MESDWLTIDEAAKLLKLHAVTVRRHMRQDKLPGRKIGGEWRISREALDQFIRGDQKPAAPTDSGALRDQLKGKTAEHADPPRLEDEGQSGG
jgi:excisionase family DNA binding protein